jgi:hypothetical protein
MMIGRLFSEPTFKIFPMDVNWYITSILFMSMIYSQVSGNNTQLNLNLNPMIVQELDKHMNIINNSTSWQQGSVDTLNDLFFMNASLPIEDWKDYFRIYFETHHFSSNLQYYIQHPTFWWLDNNTHDMLQRAIISGLQHL